MICTIKLQYKNYCLYHWLRPEHRYFLSLSDSNLRAYCFLHQLCSVTLTSNWSFRVTIPLGRICSYTVGTIGSILIYSTGQGSAGGIHTEGLHTQTWFILRVCSSLTHPPLFYFTWPAVKLSILPSIKYAQELCFDTFLNVIYISLFGLSKSPDHNGIKPKPKLYNPNSLGTINSEGEQTNGLITIWADLWSNTIADQSLINLWSRVD